MSIAAILLAAGASQRLGQPKQLLSLHGETLLARTLRLAREAELNPVVVVLGAYAHDLRAEAERQGASVVVNAAWSAGISTSIGTGLQAIAETAKETQGAMMLVCDQPFLTADHLRTLVAAFLEPPEPKIVASFYAGVRGIPALFPAAAFPELAALRGDKGARNLLRAASFPVVEIPFPAGAIDIDTVDDLKHLQ